MKLEQEFLEGFEKVLESLKNKILVGDYKFESCTEHNAYISIGNIKVTIWLGIANIGNFFKIQSIEFKSHRVHAVEFDSNEDRLKAYDTLRIPVEKYRNTVLKKDKVKEIEKLLLEISNLESEINEEEE